MNRAIATASSLAVIGVAGVTTAQAQTSSPKNWSVSASLRGFYDDNYTTTADRAQVTVGGQNVAVDDTETFGFDVRPSVSYQLTGESTFTGLGYEYGYRYFEESGEADQSHEIEGVLSHSFSENYKLDVADSFSIFQEPRIDENMGGLAILKRTEGDNIRNIARINLAAGLSEQFGVDAGYSNRLFNYEQSGDLSRSALLDRIEHTARLDGRWTFMPTSTAVLGYSYGVTDYTSDDFIVRGNATLGLPGITADERDQDSHSVYVGADHTFNPQLNGQIRLGARFTEYDDQAGSSATSPYVSSNLSYAYNENSFAQIGVIHDRNATDVSRATVAGRVPTLDQISTSIHGSITHQITPPLTGSLIGHAQLSEFEGGLYDGNDEEIYIVGLNFGYKINEFISAEAGYNYDKLSSDVDDIPLGIARGFDRNRFYLGLRASY